MFDDPHPESNASAQLRQFESYLNSNKQPRSYPKPDAEYQEVLQSPDVFVQKLQSFHFTLGSKFKIPKLGGKSLDLHHLFAEVTARGGIEKVIKDRRWKEVTAAFKFSSSITSASFVLRKYYLSLLYHFEQVYYFRKQAPSRLGAANADYVNAYASAPVNGQTAQHALVHASPLKQRAEIRKLEEGSLFTGTIEAKCDYGYVVAVELGSEKLNGVLYHVPEESQMPPRTSSLVGPSPRKRRRRKNGSRGDLSRPMPNTTGYNYFFNEHYARLEPSHLGQEEDISQKIGNLWCRLTEAERQVYHQMGQANIERSQADALYNNASL